MKTMTLTPKVKLTRTETGWKYGNSIITKHEWVLPHATTSYSVTVNGVDLDADTLGELREYIADLISD